MFFSNNFKGVDFLPVDVRRKEGYILMLFPKNFFQMEKAAQAAANHFGVKVEWRERGETRSVTPNPKKK